MKEFKPSGDFISRVMNKVYAYEKTKKPEISLSQKLHSSIAVRYAMFAGGALLGIINLIRLYFTVFSPVVCR